MLLVMGRNNVLPRKLFGYINPKTSTPTFNIILAGLVCLLGASFSLDIIVQFISFGALIAFTFVNLSVFAWFAVRQGRWRSPGDFLKFVVLPLLGVASTVILWVNLEDTAIIGGLIWAAIGLVYLIFITRFFRRKVAGFDEAQPVTGHNKVVS
jgi:putrescine importer